MFLTAFAAGLSVGTPVVGTPDPTPTVSVCSCVPTTEEDAQYRFTMKHRKLNTNDEINAVTVGQVLQWPEPPNASTSKKTRETDAVIDEREAQLFTVTGYLWTAKIEPNDCDFHFEISETNDPEAPRIIVETPNQADNTVTWDAICSFMKDRHKKPKVGRVVKFKSAPKVTVTGYPFWDGHHWTNKDHKKGVKHGSDLVGTLWEIHPVVQFRSDQ